MTDVNDVTSTTAKREAPESLPAGPERAAGTADARFVTMVELLFFAYRDFTAEPDAVLAELDFGRAHHRVLHFVSRNPGLRIADLLGILRITKQSLARVLKQLVDQGFIVQSAGASDRRERRLEATDKGRALAERLLALQTRRIAAALEAAGPAAQAHAEAFLLEMVAASDRDGVRRLTGRARARPAQQNGETT
jgi:DNA-binding MarR family transcriptional regulator